MEINLGAFICRHPDDSADMDSTLAKFRGLVEKHLAEKKAGTDKIAVAIESIFDTYRGVTLNKGAFIGATLRALNANVKNHAELKAQVESYLKEYGQLVTEEQPDQLPGKLYRVIQGPGGGICRWKDFHK